MEQKEKNNVRKLITNIIKLIVGLALFAFGLYINIDVAVHHEDGNLLVRSFTIGCIVFGAWLSYKAVLSIRTKH